MNLQLQLDTEYDKTYDGYTETGVLSCSTDRGRTSRVGISDLGEARVVVESANSRWYPDHASAIAGLARGCLARLRAVTTSGTITSFTGRVSEVRPMLAPGGQAWRAEVTLTDLAQDLSEVEVTTNLRESQAIDGLIAHIATKAAWQHSTNITADNDPATIGYAWWTRVVAWEAIDQLVTADGGIVFTQRDGTLRFHDRAWREANAGAGTAVDLAGQIYAVQEQPVEVYTACAVKVHRRRLRGSQPVWEFQGNIKLNAGQTRRKLVSLTDPVVSLAQPVFEANGKKDWEAYKQKGDGTPDKDVKRNSSITVVARRVGADMVRLKITNTHGTDKVSLVMMRVRGRPVKPRGKLTVRRENNVTEVIGKYPMTDGNESGGEFELDPIAGAYYRRRYEVDTPWVPVAGQGERLAKYLMRRIGTPQPDLTITLTPTRADATIHQRLGWDISQRVIVTSTALGLSNRHYWIENISHDFDEGGWLVTTLFVSPCFFITTTRKSRHELVAVTPTDAAL